MIRPRKWVLAACIVLLVGGLLTAAANQAPVVQAENAAAPTTTATAPPKRKAKITVDYTKYFWWMASYETNDIACELGVEHEGLPTYNDVEGICSKKLAAAWLNSKPCNFAETPVSQCPGYYFTPVGSKDGQRDIEIELPLPKVWISVADCNPQPGQRSCSTLPNLLLKAEEPLPNESILSIQGTFNGEPFSCSGDECKLPLPPTGMDGAAMEFWAVSSFGDSTEHYTARVRMVPWGDFMNPEGTSNDLAQWYVDVLSSQWTGGELASCSATWQVFPDVNGPPTWLSSPASVDGLQSEVGYYYLAASLIRAGLVDVNACLDGGLQSANVASNCGVDAARPVLSEWQNRFDSEILQTSQDTGVPAQLLKNVFARESQVWPGIFSTYQEAGLGQLTEQGADTVLLWNPTFFSKFCPLVLSSTYCELGFGNLKKPEQNILRGALVRQVNATCAECPSGIDLTQANSSVHIFAEGLLANCEQVGRIYNNITGTDAGLSSSYEDLWRFTLVNYNAGPGCLGKAFNGARNIGQPLDWAHVSALLEPGCQAAIGYVQDISLELRPSPTPTAWLPNQGSAPTLDLPRVRVTASPTAVLRPGQPTPTLNVTVTRTPTATPSASSTGPAPTATPTLFYP